MNGKKIMASPSVLAADFGDLKTELQKIQQFHIPYVHIDIMDGHFVPNISFGSRITQDIKKNISAKLDIHLMIQDTEKYIDDFIACDPDIITFHQESVKFYFRMINLLKEKGIKVGIALNPGTPLSSIENLLPYLDVVLLMTVDPGFYGQAFIEGMVKKIEELYLIRKRNNYQFLIEADGGINNQTIEKIGEFIDMAVLGKAFFKNPDLEDLMHKLNS